MTEQRSASPFLTGIRVLELGGGVAGSTPAAVPAALGADVVKAAASQGTVRRSSGAEESVRADTRLPGVEELHQRGTLGGVFGIGIGDFLGEPQQEVGRGSPKLAD